MKTNLIIAGFLSFAFASKAQTPGLQVTSGTNGQSGLKFTNINSSTTASSSNGKVLSVNTSGEVIVVPDVSGSGSFGGAQNGCSLGSGSIVELGGPLGSASSAQLLGNREIPMNSKNLLFSGMGNNGKDQFTIGGTPVSFGKLNVVAQELTGISPAMSNAASIENRFTGGAATALRLTTNSSNNFMNYGLTGEVSNGTNNYGIFLNVGNAQTNGVNTGARLEVVDASNTAGGCVGVSVEVRGAGNGNDNIGLSGLANSTVGRNFGAAFSAGSTNNTQSNFGLQSNCDATGANNMAGYFQSPNPNNVPNNAPVFNAAIRAYAPSRTANGANWVNSYAGYFDGDVTINGIGVISSGIWNPSDKRLKKNVKDLTSALDLLGKVNPKTYNYEKSNFANLTFDENRLEYGVIAQELEEVMPQLVKEITVVTNKDPNSPETQKVKTVNYIELIPILVAAVKEQQQQINELKQANNEMQHRGASGISNINTDLGFQMSQNEPNPFTHETLVKYNLPTTVTSAFMAVYDLTGKQITTFPINETGNSSIVITADKLAAGIYIYSIVADGKVVDSKRMIVSEK
jgi:hypothetical protein